MSNRSVALRRAVLEDRADIFEWRNDPASQHFSKTSGPVDWAAHVSWYAGSLLSPDRVIHIGCSGGAKIGMVRFDTLTELVDTVLVSIVIAPERRGQGWGKELLAASIALGPMSTYLAEVDQDNIASQRIFKACDFERVSDDDALFSRYRSDLILFRKVSV